RVGFGILHRPPRRADDLLRPRAPGRRRDGVVVAHLGGCQILDVRRQLEAGDPGAIAPGTEVGASMHRAWSEPAPSSVPGAIAPGSRPHTQVLRGFSMPRRLSLRQ